jgi:hypothetical protein
MSAKYKSGSRLQGLDERCEKKRKDTKCVQKFEKALRVHFLDIVTDSRIHFVLFLNFIFLNNSKDKEYLNNEGAVE